MNRIERARTRGERDVIDRDKIYSFDETRSIMSVSAPTLRRYLNLGKVGGKKIGGKWFITGAALIIALDPFAEKRLNSERPHDNLAESSS